MSAEPAESLLAAEVEILFRVAYRLTGDPHEAEDLVQDVCERALSRAPRFATAGDCRRWLLRVLYNRFVDGCRHRQRSPIMVSGTNLLVSGTDFAAGTDYADYANGGNTIGASDTRAIASAAQSDRAITGPDPAELAAQSDAESTLLRAWQKLEPEQQMLLLLRAEGHDLDEIAAIADIDKPALSSRLYRARASLARYLDAERAAEGQRLNPEKAR